MSGTRFWFQIKLLPTALAATLVMLGSATLANAQSDDQGYPPDQSAPQYQSAQTDPSSRVARLAYLSGDVEFAPAGESDFGSADVNRPLTTGDRLLTGDDGRAALELGGAALRIDHGSAFNFLDLTDTTAQVELSQGTLNLGVRDAGNGQTYEIDTPTVAFVASQPGTYRVDVAPDGHGAMVTVFDGAGTVYGENGVSRPVDGGQSYRFNDSGLTNVDVSGLPSPDDFDRWAESRDNRSQNSVSRRYVSPDVIGYDDLDQYGAWQDTSDYGTVWYPTQVYSGWAPYRDGHWAWIEPWGWTWVDNAPWGFAPFHYGRWVYVGNRWGWCPGQRAIRPVYAPALVAFVGGSGFSVSISLGGGGPVGWFPLGPRDIYVPPYRASRNYFTSINVTNIRNVYVNKTVINNYYGNYAAQRPMNEARYAYRNNPHAFTAVPRNVFTGAKPVRNAVLHVPPRSIAQAQVMSTPRIAPTKASLAIRPPKRPIATPARAFDRTVVAKHTPPPRPVSFAARERVIAKQGGAPIPVQQLRQMRQQNAPKQPERVKVVAAKPQIAKPLPPMKRVQNLTPSANRAPVAQAPGRTPVRAPENKTGKYPPGQAHISPVQTPVRPTNGPAQNAPKQASLRPGELPSARFAHPQRNANPATPAASERAAQTQAQQSRQRDQMEQQQAQLHNQQAQQAQQKAGQARVQQQQAQQREAQSRQQAGQARVQQQQAQQRAAQAGAQQQAQQRQAQTEQQRADQARAQQQAQQRQAQMEQQRADQARAQQQAQQRQAQTEQQRADQARSQQQAQQRDAQARQRDEQRAQQAQQQRADQARQAQMQQQQRQAQMQAAQQQQTQQTQHAPPQPHQPPPPPKKKDHDDQDNGH